jgi:CheY-like chemotaxis protein
MDHGGGLTARGAQTDFYQPSGAQARSDGKKRILVVDDDRTFLELAERLLVREGFNVLATDNARGVLQLARTARPDLVLLDILMPDLDGWTVLKALKQDPITAMVPVLILSIVDEKGKARDEGALGIVAKPVDRTVLLKAVQEACGLSAPKRTASPTQAAVA